MKRFLNSGRSHRLVLLSLVALLCNTEKMMMMLKGQKPKRANE